MRGTGRRSGVATVRDAVTGSTATFAGLRRGRRRRGAAGAAEPRSDRATCRPGRDAVDTAARAGGAAAAAVAAPEAGARASARCSARWPPLRQRARRTRTRATVLRAKAGRCAPRNWPPSAAAGRRQRARPPTTSWRCRPQAAADAARPRRHGSAELSRPAGRGRAGRGRRRARRGRTAARRLGSQRTEVSMRAARRGGRTRGVRHRGAQRAARCRRRSSVTMPPAGCPACSRRARAAQLLRSVMVRHRDDTRQRYVDPFRAEVERLGRIVFGADLRGRDRQRPQICSRTLDGRTVPYESLSGGAKEQLGHRRPAGGRRAGGQRGRRAGRHRRCARLHRP